MTDHENKTLIDICIPAERGWRVLTICLYNTSTGEEESECDGKSVGIEETPIIAWNIHKYKYWLNPVHHNGEVIRSGEWDTHIEIKAITSCEIEEDQITQNFLLDPDNKIRVSDQFSFLADTGLEGKMYEEEKTLSLLKPLMIEQYKRDARMLKRAREEREKKADMFPERH